MIRLGTVFSGIGAIEHALERLGIEHKIEFACDNGDVDILSKKINEDFFSIREEISELKSLVKDDVEKEPLEFYLKTTEKIEKEVEKAHIDENEVYQVLESYRDTGKSNSNQNKAYIAFENQILAEEGNLDKKLLLMRLSIKLESDIKRSAVPKNQAKEILSAISSRNSKYKVILKELKNLAENISMVHERINTEIIRSEVFSIDDFNEQKKYVDNLYKNYETRNKVMETYLANYDIDPNNFHWNVSFLDGRRYKDKIDLFVGGSPCQSFSLVGKQRGLDDTRGTLFYEFARLVGEIHPKVFIYENVKAILSNDGGETWKTMTEIFGQLGYDWSYEILNAKDYGIPQNRERVFVVGFRKDLKVKDFVFPKSIPLEKSMKDFLLDNVSGKYYLPKKGVNFVTSEKNLEKRFTQIDGDIQLCQKKNQQFNWHGDFVFEEDCVEKEKLMDDLEKYFLSEKVKKYVLSTGTKGFYSRPEIDLDIARPLLQTMHKMHRAGVDNYVTTDGRIRKLTPRECLRLMGFCDSFKIVVSDTSMYQQSGNSIVVDVLMHIVLEIIRAYPILIKGE
jgi:DNA (cytosine-5)-methyltransferase 1